MLLPGIDIDVRELINLRHVVGALEVQSRKRARSLLAGTELSPFKGRGIDFEEVRRYQAGDDVRHMDWRVTARTGHPHLKVFREERERPVFFLVDFRPSMRFGTKVAFKSVIAAHTATLLAWTSMKKGDRVGGILCSEDRHTELRPAGGREAVLQLIHAMAELHGAARKNRTCDPGQQGVPLSSAMQRLVVTARPGSQIFLISDFVGFDVICESFLSQLALHCEIVCIMTFDPLEAVPPPPGLYRVSDGLRTSWLDTSHKQTVEMYRRHYESRVSCIQSLCTKEGLGFFTLATNQKVSDGVREGFRKMSATRWHHHVRRSGTMG